MRGTSGSSATPRRCPRLPTVVVHPCDQPSMGAALEAFRLGLIAPILVGPLARMQEAAQALGMDISGLELVEFGP